MSDLDSLLDTIAELDDDCDNWADAARWNPAEGWVDHDDDDPDDPDGWYMEYTEDHPPPVVTRDGVRWLS